MPIGGQSVWASESPIASDRPIVLIATKMDSVSDAYMTDDGRVGVTVSIFLAIIKAIRSLSFDHANQFVVAFFQGESWGRGGSRLWVSEIQSFSCLQSVEHSQSPFNDRICTSPLKVTLLIRVHCSCLSTSQNCLSIASNMSLCWISFFPISHHSISTMNLQLLLSIFLLFSLHLSQVCHLVLLIHSSKLASIIRMSLVDMMHPSLLDT